MKHINHCFVPLGTLILALGSIWFIGLPTARSADNAQNDNAYKDLYFSRVSADLAKFTAILERLDQGDTNTARNVMVSYVKGDLKMLTLETNYTLSKEQRQAITFAEKYLKRTNH